MLESNIHPLHGLPYVSPTFPPFARVHFLSINQLDSYINFSTHLPPPTQFSLAAPQILRAILQQLHRPNDSSARRQRAIRKRRPLRARRGLALQRRGAAVRDARGQGEGERADGFAAGEGDVRVA